MQTREEKSRYLKERREWLHEHHFCTSCKKQDARTLIGKWECFECAEKGRVRKSGLKYNLQERKEMGLCHYCMNPVIEGLNVCQECYDRIKKASVASHINHTPRPKVEYSTNPQMPRSEWVENGYCRNCGDKVLEGYKVCEKCRQHLIDISIKRKELNQDYLWRNSMNSLFSKTY